MGRAQKEKGRKFEKAVADLLASATGLPVKRVICSGPSGEGDIDKMCFHLAGLPFHLECRDRKRIGSLHSWYKDEECRLGDKEDMVLIHHQPYERTFVTMDIEAWARLVEKALERKCQCDSESPSRPSLCGGKH